MAVQGAPGDPGWTFIFEKNPLWQLKLRLQWSGWLQHIMSLQIPLFFYILSRIESYWTGEPSFILLPISQLLLLNWIMDVVFIKFGWAPPEALPESPKAQQDGETSTLDIIMSRHSCRSFQRRHLIDKHKQVLLELLSKYEGGVNKSGSKLVFTTKPLQVWPPVNAQQFIVALGPKEYSKHAVIDVGRYLEHVVIQAQKSIGLATCWIGPGTSHESILNELNDMDGIDNYHPICVLAVGYASKFWPLMIRLISYKLSHSRLPLEQLFFLDSKCTVPLNIQDDPVLIRMKPAFEACQWSPSSFNAQTTRGVLVIEQEQSGITNGSPQRLVWKRLDFYRSVDSRYYATVALGIWQAHWEMACSELGIKGKFCVVDKMESTQLPLYDVSWVFDEPIPLTRFQRDSLPG